MGRPPLPEARKSVLFVRMTERELQAAKTAWKAAREQEPGLSWGAWVRRQTAAEKRD